MAPSSVATTATKSSSLSKTKKNISAAIKIRTSKDPEPATSSIIPSSVHSTSTMFASEATSSYSEFTMASGSGKTSTASVDFTSGSINFEDIRAETALHKLSIKLVIDIFTGDLVAEGVFVRGKRINVRFKLAEQLGNDNGELVWKNSHTDYYKTCKDIKIVIEHDGCYIVARCKKYNNEWKLSRFNLSEVLHISRGRFQLRSFDAELNKTLSEVPWMKVKVVAEPDYAVFCQDQVMQTMMSHIAASTVQHVTEEMSQQIALAMETAKKGVTESATVFAMEQIQVILQSPNMYGRAQRSSTKLEHLHIV